MSERITDEMTKKSTKNELNVVAKIHDEGKFMNFPKPKEETFIKPKTPEPMVIHTQFKRDFDITQTKLDTSLMGKIRGVQGDGKRESLDQAWKEIKHSKLANEKLELFLRQAKIKKTATRQLDSLESQVSRTLQMPLFSDGLGSSSSIILSNLRNADLS